MSRLVFRKGEQAKFLVGVMDSLNINSDELGSLIGISGRSFRYWISEKTLGTRKGLLKLSQLSGIELPRIIEEREDWWSGRVNGRSAAQIRIMRCGPPGCEWGRRKGGLVSQQKRRENPDYYRSLGCNIPKLFHLPDKSEYLAEFFGTILGDGGITDYQLTITLNSIADRLYREYVTKRSVQLFGHKPSVYEVKDAKAVRLVLGGRKLIDFLQDNGLRIGDKVKHQVDVPEWIKENLAYSIRCVRGLVDTDGGVFEHKYKVNGKQYKFLKVNFTNMSGPLLRFVGDTLERIGLTPKYQSMNKVWLYGKGDIERYFCMVGSSNYRLISKLRWYNLDYGGMVQPGLRHKFAKLEPDKGFVGSNPTASATIRLK